MQDTVVDRLAKVITTDDEPEKPRRIQQAGNLLKHLHLAEGWFSFFLLALVVYSTIWCVQAVNWVDHLGLLTPLTALGLILGVIAAKQRRIPRLVVHSGAVVLSVLFAFWQTSIADYSNHSAALLNSMHTWFSLALNGGTSSDASIFLFLILTLGFLLAYTSAWLLYRTRSPWLMLLANAVVLLINLSNIDLGYVIFLIIFLLAAFLLLLRFNLYESSTAWKRQGLRCSDDLNWEFMQAGAMISVGILILSWLLPWGYTNGPASQIWSTNNNPWVQAQNMWNRLLAVSGGNTPQNHGNFTNLLTLGGNPNLINTPVFEVKTTDGSQYLVYSSYDEYDGVSHWISGSQNSTPNPSDTVDYDQSDDLVPVIQTIRVINPPGEQYGYIFGAPQIAETNQVTQLISNKSDGEVVAWMRTNGKLAAGDVYSVVSYVSDADITTLRTVPLPADSPPLPNVAGSIPPTYFDPTIVATYTKVPKSLDPRIKQLAEQITAQAPTMYDKVTALETYLRNNYKYNAQITAPPAGTEATSWFLFQSKQGGFCNYFATAMALMARELGIPARVAAGYTNGILNDKTGNWDINGTDAHAWTQIYFAGYGWINFEPSATFSTFVRPVKSSVVPGNQVNPGGSAPGDKNGSRNRLDLGDHESGSTTTPLSTTDTAAQIRTDVGIVLLILIAFILGGLIYFTFWWRRLYRGLSVPTQLYGRVSLLAGWAGVVHRRSQTPREYMQTVATVAPEDAVVIERLGDIYTRERWADPESAEHPRRSGESADLPGLWQPLQRRLMAYMVRHPYFLRSLPSWLGSQARRFFFRGARRSSSTVVVEEHLEQ